MSDALLIVGAILFSVGAGLAWLPAGVMVGGLFMLIAGLKLAGGG